MDCAAFGVAQAVVPRDHRHELVGEPVDLSRQYLVDDLLFRVGDERGERRPFRNTTHLDEQLRERRLTRRVDEHTVDRVERFVAGRAFDRPGGKLLVAFEDLLDHDPRVAGGRPQPGEVLGRETQAVDVVDADSVSEPSANQPRMRRWVSAKTVGSSTRTPMSVVTSKNRR